MKKFIKQTIAALLVGLSANVMAVDNSIYIDQSGDNATVNITQDGAGNVVRGIQGVGSSNTTPSTIYGDNNQITINQVGSGNTLSMGVKTTTGSGMGNPTVNYSVTGNNATAIINSNNAGSGVSESNSISVTQSGNNANLNLNMLGSGNTFNATTAGGANNSLIATINANTTSTTISQTGGGGNSTTLNMTGDKGTVDITTVGASNVTSITQSGGSTNGHSTKLDYTGSGNTTSITQGGTSGDSIVNIKSVGSSNSFTINSNTR
jgi:YD repeat-containing protein